MTPWWLVMTASAAETTPEDFRGYIDQARFFIRKSWFADAREELERAVQSADGRLDAEAWFLLAQVCYELGDGPAARHAADRAHVHSRDEEQAHLAASLVEWLDTQLGYLEVRAAAGPASLRIELRSESLLLDPQLKAYFGRVQESLRKPIRLPRTLALPAGTYTLNGAQVQVDAGAQVAHEVMGRAGGRPPEIELGVGVVAWRGAGRHLPAPTTSLAVSLPLGPLILGAMGDWTYQPYRARNRVIYGAPDGWSAGVRVGVEAPGTAPLVLRASVGARVTHLPGLEQACARTDDAWTCGGAPDTRPLYVYPSGLGAGPLVELSALYLDRGRRHSLGGGVKVSGEQLWGRIPAASTSHTSAGAAYPWSATETGWSALGLRALAHLVYAF